MVVGRVGKLQTTSQHVVAIMVKLSDFADMFIPY